MPREGAAQALRERDLEEARSREKGAGEALAHVEAGRRAAEQLSVRLRDPDSTLDEITRLAQKAVRAFQSALKLRPDLPEALLALARVYALVTNPDVAIETLDRAIAAAPGLSAAYLERGRLRAEKLEALCHQSDRTVRTPETEELRKQVEADLARVREPRESLYALALLAFAHADYAAALERIDRYLEAMPGDGEAHGCRGHTLYHLGRYEEAEAALSKAIAEHGHCATLFNLRAAVRRRLGKPEAALQDFTRVVQNSPKVPFGYIGRAKVLESLGRHDEAIADATVALTLDPASYEAYWARALARTRKKDRKGAEADYAKAIEFGRESAELYLIYFNRGTVRDDLGDFTGAVADYTRSIELRPVHVEAWLNRGITRMHMQSWAPAVEDFTKVIELRPAWAEGY